MMDKSYPPVSILIVTYNASKYIQRCLDSIALQTYPAVEVVIVDGASSDETANIVEKNSSVVNLFISEPDDGIYDAMNKGLDHITGDWVYFIGADDVLLPGFSDMLFNELKEPNTIYYGHAIINGVKDLGYLPSYRFARIGICHQAIVYPRNVFKKYRYHTKYRLFADYYLNIVCWNDKDFKFEYRDYTLANYNHTGVSSLNVDEVFIRDKSWIVWKHFGFFIWCRTEFKNLKTWYKTKLDAIYKRGIKNA